ncbi:methylated-DNA--[protein]-cysteine S-methyltransferase [Rheinheimera sp. YQF-2]|uniref:Methylated-DNA--protein-cysteine methyltransferase n=1 Tax=Rheinheimera lutimaris TaxID=2740584 RepID=A0A7Y5ATZ1_9GAMM|nr:methylated-DNA--[protein]-cysteine S-methyltransferase [Rheinheimera lutimaris]NRQ44517.1 methylated-DNA--[protein]-cysteine S-methyltransferase [Rheinheimera lutimaris]
MFSQFIDSPLGPVQISATDHGISAISFVTTPRLAVPSALTERAATQLLAYFAGTLTQFDLPLAAQGTTFQHQVWRELCNVPFGTTCSYGDIARAISNIKAVRAVGAANGRNPVAIVVPCHRVIGANGTLTGYAGGLDKKAWLLKHEQRPQALLC